MSYWILKSDYLSIIVFCAIFRVRALLKIRIFLHWQDGELFKGAVYRYATPHFKKFDNAASVQINNF